MGKISSQVSKGLGEAIAEAQTKINGDNSAEVLLNSGVIAHKKRLYRSIVL